MKRNGGGRRRKGKRNLGCEERASGVGDELRAGAALYGMKKEIRLIGENSLSLQMSQFLVLIVVLNEEEKKHS